MAPINFENNIKNKLDERRLKPSTDAWDKLSERLDNQDKKNNKKPYWWLGLAASIVGVLFIVSQFLNNETQVKDAPKIVDTQEIIQEKETNIIATENEIFVDVKDANVKVGKETTKKIETLKLVSPKEKKAFVASVNERKIISKEKTNAIAATAELPKKPVTFEEQKIQDVVAQVQYLKNENKVITDADIEALLEEAQKEIMLNRLYNGTTGVVDAIALLQDVEAELDQSFRSKVFEALKSSYKSVKTAVAQRND
ncbi:hypothetical protein [uncultured Algibacter sp.]|uniref:hypothetical protein n=1 Tax=uncultured Algibacter sp. TaxID=298659 RepID=UPI0030EEEAF6|tara:strand:+ start:1984 stop:2748 length:765 start_codon:yes stop_codon:yes gene_type:complete